MPSLVYLLLSLVLSGALTPVKRGGLSADAPALRTLSVSAPALRRTAVDTNLGAVNAPRLVQAESDMRLVSPARPWRRMRRLISGAMMPAGVLAAALGMAVPLIAVIQEAADNST